MEQDGVSLVDMNRVIQEDGYYLSEILVLEERMESIAVGGRALLERIRTTERLSGSPEPEVVPEPSGV